MSSNEMDVNLTADLDAASNASSASERPILSELTTLRHIALVVYLVTSVFGLIGNTLTIIVIIRYKKMHSVANLFILNLALADNFFVLNMPFMAHNTYSQDWVFGSLLCKLMTASYGTNLYASIFTMVLMSVDRLLAGAWPLRSIRYRTVRKAGVVCVLIWLSCIVIMTPYWMYADTYESVNGTTRCRISWPRDSRMEHLWFWTNFELIVGFVAPILLMVCSYGLLVRHLYHNQGVFKNQSKTPIKKVTIMISLVTIVFIVCWTPYHILRYSNTLRAFRFMRTRVGPSSDDQLNAAIFNTVAQALVFVSSCCNPVIYGANSRSFRQLYFDVACTCCPGYRPRTPLRCQQSSYSTKMTIMERSRSLYESRRRRERDVKVASRSFDELEPETLLKKE